MCLWRASSVKQGRVCGCMRSPRMTLASSGRESATSGLTTRDMKRFWLAARTENLCSILIRAGPRNIECGRPPLFRRGRCHHDCSRGEFVYSETCSIWRSTIQLPSRFSSSVRISGSGTGNRCVGFDPVSRSVSVRPSQARKFRPRACSVWSLR